MSGICRTVCDVLEIGRTEEFSALHAAAANDAPARAEGRDEHWTKSVAAGSRAFVQGVADQLGTRALNSPLKK